MFRNVRYCTLLTLCLLLAVRPADARSAAEDVLERRGLVRQQQVWVLPLEVEMQQQVRRLPKLESDLIESRSAAQRLAQSLLTAHAQLSARIETAETNVRTLQALREAARSSGRRKIDARIASEQQQAEQLRAAVVPPEEIAGTLRMRTAMIQLVNSRNDLTAALLWIHDTRPALRTQYELLAGDREITRAIGELGDEHRLSTGEQFDSDAFLRKLARFELHVFTDEVPLYLQGEDLQVSAIINRTPITFTWNEYDEPTMLTASVIEASGLKVPKDAERLKHRFPDGRELVVRRFEIPYLRFGRHVLKNVEALALPPEAERYGAQIGPTGFADHSPRAEPEKMRLVIR